MSAELITMNHPFKGETDAMVIHDYFGEGKHGVRFYGESNVYRLDSLKGRK